LTWRSRRDAADEPKFEELDLFLLVPYVLSNIGAMRRPRCLAAHCRRNRRARTAELRYSALSWHTGCDRWCLPWCTTRH